MKGVFNGRTTKNTKRYPEAEDLDIPPTQRIEEEDFDEMHGESPPEGYLEDEPEHNDNGAGVEMPEQPDLGWYFSNWDISPKGQIALCRTFANYLSAKLPKTVEAKAGCYSGRKRTKK